MRDTPEAIKRWKDQVEGLTGCFRLTKMQWVSMEKKLNSSGKFSQDLHHCFRREIPTRLGEKEHPARGVQGQDRPRAKRPPRTRSSEALDADAREIERLARRVEQHSQRMVELLRRGVLEPSLAYAFLMKKGGQRIPQAKSRAKARASSRATTSEGAEAAPDTSPPRLPPERPPMVFTRGETMVPSNAGPEVRTSDRA